MFPKLAALTLCFSLAYPFAANADLLQSKAAYKAACKADIKRLCADEKGSKGACLKQHKKELSSECRDARKAYRQAKKSS